MLTNPITAQVLRNFDYNMKLNLSWNVIIIWSIDLQWRGGLHKRKKFWGNKAFLFNWYGFHHTINHCGSEFEWYYFHIYTQKKRQRNPTNVINIVLFFFFSNLVSWFYFYFCAICNLKFLKEEICNKVTYTD